MARFITFAVLVVTVLFLSVSLFFTLRFNKDLVNARNNLILQKDSLQMLQIQTKKEMTGIQNYLDSVVTKENKKVLSIK
jgi:hypothetical protein